MNPSMRVLIVEDEPDLLAGLIQTLREDGYAVDFATDGCDGLFKAQSCVYDVIVLDIMLPKVDGLEVLRELRKTSAIPVLMLTARDTTADRVRGLDGGADDYLVKPFQISELKARLRAIIRRSVGVPCSLISIDIRDNATIEINMAAQTVSLGGERIELTAREYALLELLALHRGRLVSRTMIYDHLFDENHDSLSNLVDVYISRLRSQLGKELITTRRGQGYVIER